jgi:hypothetical protein
MTDTTEHIQLLESLAFGAVRRLELLTPPVVRVCGPLTSGGYGYEENLHRFRIAEERLKREGETIFDYFADNSDEVFIKDAGIPWELVMEHYHKPILSSGLIAKAYFMPKWQTSNGASWERDYIENFTAMQISELDESWFTT